MKRYLILSLLCTLYIQTGIFIESANAHEKTSIEKLPCNITVFGNHQKYPKSFLKDGVPHGIHVDMLSYIGKEMGCHFNVKLYSWKQSYTDMMKGYGGVMGLSKTSERLKVIDYSDVMFYDELKILVKKGKEFEYKSIEDLKGKKILATKGASYGDEWDRYIKEGLIELIDDSGVTSKQIELLLKNRADVAIIGPGMAAVEKAIQEYPFLKLNRNQIITLERPFKRDPNYLGFSKESNKKEFLKEFNKYIKKGYDTGAFQAIIEKYSSSHQ